MLSTSIDQKKRTFNTMWNGTTHDNMNLQIGRKKHRPILPHVGQLAISNNVTPSHPHTDRKRHERVTGAKKCTIFITPELTSGEKRHHCNPHAQSATHQMEMREWTKAGATRAASTCRECKCEALPFFRVC